MQSALHPRWTVTKQKLYWEGASAFIFDNAAVNAISWMERFTYPWDIFNSSIRETAHGQCLEKGAAPSINNWKATGWKISFDIAGHFLLVASCFVSAHSYLLFPLRGRWQVWWTSDCPQTNRIWGFRLLSCLSRYGTLLLSAKHTVTWNSTAIKLSGSRHCSFRVCFLFLVFFPGCGLCLECCPPATDRTLPAAFEGSDAHSVMRTLHERRGDTHAPHARHTRRRNRAWRNPGCALTYRVIYCCGPFPHGGLIVSAPCTFLLWTDGFRVRRDTERRVGQCWFVDAC